MILAYYVNNSNEEEDKIRDRFDENIFLKFHIYRAQDGNLVFSDNDNTIDEKFNVSELYQSMVTRAKNNLRNSKLLSKIPSKYIVQDNILDFLPVHKLTQIAGYRNKDRNLNLYDEDIKMGRSNITNTINENNISQINEGNDYEINTSSNQQNNNIVNDIANYNLNEDDEDFDGNDLT